MIVSVCKQGRCRSLSRINDGASLDVENEMRTEEQNRWIESKGVSMRLLCTHCKHETTMVLPP